LQHSRASTISDFQTAHKTFEQALLEIPKSGEVWCEGARLAMSNHPNNVFFNIEKALKYLDFAI
jgi:hypothetical protein